MKTYLGLGSNLGDRRAHLRTAIKELDSSEVTIRKISPIVESPALLLDDAKPEWNRPFLNLAVSADTSLSPTELLRLVKRIETKLGRDSAARWAPRTMDIDILLYGTEVVQAAGLSIPHPAIHTRAFVLTPLIALDAGLRIPGMGPRTVLEWSTTLEHHIPLWMGIVNITPDSFSDGGEWQTWRKAETHIAEAVDAGAQIIDLGAESTRPGAAPIGDQEEWTRLAPILERLVDKYRDDALRPRISVDTYHPAIARRALAAGADIVNDVSGLTSDDMIALAASGDSEWVAMHQVSLPADPTKTLSYDANVTSEVLCWFDKQTTRWQRAGLDTNRIYADPGIGFGKNPLQSLRLLQHASALRQFGLRTLIGHSRKSFMGSFSPSDNENRDLTTIGASLSLVQKGVDVLRVHNVPAHAAAYRGFAHLTLEKNA